MIPNMSYTVIMERKEFRATRKVIWQDYMSQKAWGHVGRPDG